MIYYWWYQWLWYINILLLGTWSVQFSSVVQSCLTLCDPTNRSTTGLPVHHQLPESTQTHVHWVGDAIQPSHPLSSPSLPALNLSQHQGLFKQVISLHLVAKVLEFQPQHQSHQWKPRTDLLWDGPVGYSIEIRKLMSHGLNCFYLMLLYFVTVFHIKGNIFRMNNFFFW